MEIKEYIPKTMALIELDFTEPEDIEKEEPKTLKEIIEQETNQDIKDLARDIADIRRKSNKNYSEAEVEAEVLQEILNRNKNEIQHRKEDGKYFDREKFDEENPKEKSIKSEKNNSAKSNQVTGNVTVTCNIANGKRKCYVKKKPTFKCKAGGKVYVEIKVDRIGRVKSANVNDLKSTTTNQCLIDNALFYAKNHTKAKADLKGGKSSKGYIIYNFIGQ